VKHVVQFSTGAGSAEVAYRVADAHGIDDLILLTADTRVEDDDNWRFAKDVVDDLGVEFWFILADGRTPMQVGRAARVVPNNRMAVCSRVLKRDLLRKWIDENCDPAALGTLPY
jgi:PP-loop superfamily ATP-utilizing enzyme